MSKIYFRKKVLKVGTEASYGAGAGGSVTAVQTRELTVQPLEGDKLELNLDKPDFGSDLGSLIGKHVTVSFKVPLAGSGTAGTAPAWGVLMQLCGHSETVTASTNVIYEPSDSVPPSGEFVFEIGKLVLQSITGARGSVKLTTAKREYAWLEFTFMGLFNAPTAVGTPLTADYSAWKKPVPFRAATVACSMFGQTVGLHRATFDFGQQVEFYEHSEEESIQITDRKATFDGSFEEPDIGTHDFIADINSDTSGVLSYAHGITAGNICTVTSPASQSLSVQRSDEQGISALQVNGPMVAAADGSEPDYTITLT